MKEFCEICNRPIPGLTGSMYVKSLGKELCTKCLQREIRKDKPLNHMRSIAMDNNVGMQFEVIVADCDDEPEEY